MYPKTTQRNPFDYAEHAPGTAFTTAQGVTLRPWALWPMGGEAPARTARDMVRVAFADELAFDDDTTDRACQAVHELVANAFEHGAGRVWVSLWLAWDSVAVHVSDEDTDTPVEFPAYRHAPVRQWTPEEFDAMTDGIDIAALERHRGLWVVAHQSRGRCGVAHHPHGKSVWFALTAPWRDDHRPPTRAIQGVRSLPGRVVPLDPQRPVGAPA